MSGVVRGLEGLSSNGWLVIAQLKWDYAVVVGMMMAVALLCQRENAEVNCLCYDIHHPAQKKLA